MKKLKKLIRILIAIFPWFLIGFVGFFIIDMIVDGSLMSKYFGLYKAIGNIENSVRYLLYVMLVGITVRLIKAIPGILNWIFSAITRTSSRRLLWDTYKSFLNKYSSEGKIINVLRTHWMLFSNINNAGFTISDEELLLFKTPFENKYKLILLQQKIKKFIGENNFIRKEFLEKEDYITFYVSKGKLTGKQLESKLLEISEEITGLFNGELDVKVSILNDQDVKVELFRKNIWDIKSVNLDEISLNAGELLLGFFPELTKEGIINKDLKIFDYDLKASIIVGSSRSGKDITLLNLIWSVLYNIKNYNQFELFCFDTKMSDAVYLDGLRSHGIYRYNDYKEFPMILENLNGEMYRRQKLVGINSNIQEYNKTSEKKLKVQYIILNELMALFTSLEGEQLTKIVAMLNNLLTQGLGVGMKVIFLTQSIRRDLNQNMGKLLVNISSKFILKVNNTDELEIVTRGLGKQEISTVKNIQKYNTCWIEDNEIKQEFRAFNLTQKQVLGWIEKNFEKEVIKFGDNQKLNDYYCFVIKNKTLSLSEAKNKFGLTRTDRDTLIRTLEGEGRIIRHSNNSISLK